MKLPNYTKLMQWKMKDCIDAINRDTKDCHDKWHKIDTIEFVIETLMIEYIRGQEDLGYSQDKIREKSKEFLDQLPNGND